MSVDERPNSDMVGEQATGPAAAPVDPPALLDTTWPEKIGEYEVEGIIDQDECAVVYCAADNENQRIVAVKWLRQAMADDPEIRAKFVRAGESALGAKTDYTASVFGVGEHEGRPYVVLQYGSGGTLADRIDRKLLLEPAEAVHLGLVIASALNSAHTKGVFHRDVRPGNVLWDTTCWRYRLVDFGLTTKFDPYGANGAELRVEKVAYRSPEQARGEAIDAKSDLFSLGAVLFASLVGESPFHAETADECLWRIRDADADDLRKRVENCPPGLAALVARLLQKKPEARFESAEHATLELRRLDGVGMKKPKRSNTTVLDRGTLGSPVLRFAGVVALGVLACAVLAMAIHFTRAPVRENIDEVADASGSPATKSPSGHDGRFGVLGDSSTFASLSEAIAAASNDGVVEIHGNERITCDSMQIHGKKLTIRAARGDRPVLAFADQPSRVASAISTDANLSLVGIAIQTTPATSGEDDAVLQHAAVLATGGELRLEHCAIEVDGKLTCVAAAGASVDIHSSRLSAPNGVCIGWRPVSGEEKLRCENSVCAGHCDVLVALDGSSGDASAIARRTAAALDFQRTTCSGDEGVELLIANGPRTALDVRATQTVFGVGNLLVIHRTENAPSERDLASIAGLRKVLGKELGWRDRENSFGSAMQFIAWRAMNQPATKLGASPRNVADWERFWNQRATGSERMTVGKGPSSAVGADERFVGPGRGDSPLPEHSTKI